MKPKNQPTSVVRSMILEQLAQGPATAHEIARRLMLCVSTVSNELRNLRGTQVRYGKPTMPRQVHIHAHIKARASVGERPVTHQVFALGDQPDATRHFTRRRSPTPKPVQKIGRCPSVFHLAQVIGC